MKKYRLLLVAAIVVGGALAVVADRHISRDDRIVYDGLVNDAISVRDQLLRYQDETGALPPSLDELIPKYLTRDQVYQQDAPLYTYDVSQRFFERQAHVPIQRLGYVQQRLLRLELPTGEALRQVTSMLKQALPKPGPLNERFVTLGGVDTKAPPQGAFVFEAELMSETNYGWEARVDARASGGAHLHSKEGIGNGPGQKNDRVGDFYQFKATQDLSFLRYHFRLPAAGRYDVWARMWTTGSHCSNTLLIGVNANQGRHRLNNQTPFQWRWTKVQTRAQPYQSGDNFLHVYIHEDGIKLDQIMLVPAGKPVTGKMPFAPNLVPTRNTLFAEQSPLVQVSFDLMRSIVDDKHPLEAKVVLLPRRSLEGKAKLKVEWIDPREGKDAITLLKGEIDLASIADIAFLPIPTSAVDWASLASTEYTLKATMILPDGQILRQCTPIMRPFTWQTVGPVKYVRNPRPGPYDGNVNPKPGDEKQWKPLPFEHFDMFGVLDFGLNSNGNSLRAPQMVTMYAQTRVTIPRDGEYLLKIQSDDQMMLWLNGDLLYRHDKQAPVTRSVKRLKRQFKAGTHTLRMRVNQGKFSNWGDGRWQAYLRFRTPDDTAVDVIGIR